MLFGKRELYLDAGTIYSVEDFHDQVSQLFGFPSYYGRNLDDLWDCLNSYIDTNLRLTIRDFPHLINVFGPEAEGLKEVFEKLPLYHPEMEILYN